MFLLGRLKLFAAGLAAFILALLGIYFSGRRDGAAAVKVDHMEDRLDAVKKAKAVENEINALTDDAVVRAGSEWVRKD